MSKAHKSFIDRCLDGDALLDDFDDAVEEWHTTRPPGSLASFLGLTDEEYAVLVERPDALKAILYARKYQTPLMDALASTENLSAAARASSPHEVKRIIQWLKDKLTSR